MINRWKHFISMRAYKHIKAYILSVIVTFNVGMVLICGTLLHFLAEEDFPTVGSGIWQIFTDILDPGFLSTYAQQEGTPVTRFIEVVVIVICMISFTGAIIGYISNVITTIIDNSASGPKKLYLKDHIVILNWNNKAAGIIAEYLFTEICEEVVVLTPQDRNLIIREIEEAILEMGFTKNQKHVNYTVKQGEPFSNSDLEDICIRQARTIIVLSDHDAADGDLRTLKAVMMTTQMNQSREDCAIIVETDSQNVYDLVSRIREDKKCDIIPAYLNKLLGKLLAHIAIQPELNIVFAELFSHNGNEFYSVDLQKSIGASGDEDSTTILDAYLQDHGNAIPLITSQAFENSRGKSLFVLADKKSDAYKLRTQDVPLPRHGLLIKPAYPVPKKKVIILGSNSKLKYMLNSFQAYVHNYGEDALHVIFVDTKEQLRNLPENPCFHKVYIKDRYQMSEVRRVLSRIDLTKIDTIVVLSDDTLSSVEYDSGALIAMIDINKALERIPKEKRPEVIVEILNPKNTEIVSQYDINNVIVSNRYISSMMAQLGDDDSIFNLTYDILTFNDEMDDFDQNYSNNPDSKELYIKRVGDYFEEIPVFTSDTDLIRSVYEATGKKEIVIGGIYADDKKNIKHTDKFSRTYTFRMDLDMQKELRLSPDDRLIVFASHWNN